MAKKTKNSKQNSQDVNLLPVFLIIISVLVFLSIRFISHMSNVNLNKRNDVKYEAKLSKSNYKYIDDLKYKKAIIKDANNYNLEELEFIVGPLELQDFIEKHDDDYLYYSYGKYKQEVDDIPDDKLRAIFNIHTLTSDGFSEIKDILDQAAEYADKVVSIDPQDKFIISIADYNTVENTDKIIKLVNSDKEKYKNLKMVFGIEALTVLNSEQVSPDDTTVSILALCINPFDKALKKEFPKIGLTSSYDSKEHDFNTVVEILNNQVYAMYGISRPLKWMSLVTDKRKYLSDLLKYYNTVNKGYKFIQAYYNPYTYNKTVDVLYLLKEIEKYDFHLIGGLEPYSESIFDSY